MAENNKPADDAKNMKAEYVKGVTIDELALKYNHTAEEVEAVVVTPADDTDNTVMQSEEDAKAEAAPTKKEK